MDQPSSFHNRLSAVKSQLPSQVKLIAISKTNPVAVLFEAYNAGQRVFGENKVQELIPKYQALPKDIEWHMVGHLQTNKVKYIAPFISCIHSVDSFKLLETINKDAAKCNRVIECLFEIHIAQEQSKFGLTTDGLKTILSAEELKSFKHIRITGLMGMSSLTEDTETIKNEFRHLANIFKDIKVHFFPQDDTFKELSMGMSDDYKIAIEAGSTMVRLGTVIFGKRNYNLPE
jgi:PLP dependent protein